MLYLAAVGWITLGPQPLDPRAEGLLYRLLRLLHRLPGTGWIDYGVVEFAANVAMFVPAGVFFVLLLGRRLWWLALLGAFTLSASIEFVQLFLPSRVSDPRDLVANTAGAVLGVLLALIATAARRTAPARGSGPG